MPGFDAERCELACAGRSWYADNGILDISISEYKTDVALNAERIVLVSMLEEWGEVDNFSVDYLPAETYVGFYEDDKYSSFALVSTDKNYMVTIWTISDIVEEEDFQLFIKFVTQIAKTQWEKINQQ